MIATPPQVSVWVQPGRQLHILLWVQLFVHLRYYNHVEVVIRISRIDVKRRSFKTQFSKHIKLNLTNLDQKSSQSHHSPVAKRV